MDDILQWLTNGKDYQTGIALLERHQRNRMLVQHFRHSTPKSAAAKLEYELEKTAIFCNLLSTIYHLRLKPLFRE